MDSKVIKKGIIVGFALFSTFFGAGNLIFPPGIGVASGTEWISGALGLFCSGILLPVIAVIAVNNSGGDVKNILNPVTPWFYNFFLSDNGINACYYFNYAEISGNNS